MQPAVLEATGITEDMYSITTDVKTLADTHLRQVTKVCYIGLSNLLSELTNMSTKVEYQRAKLDEKDEAEIKELDLYVELNRLGIDDDNDIGQDNGNQEETKLVHLQHVVKQRGIIHMKMFEKLVKDLAKLFLVKGCEIPIDIETKHWVLFEKYPDLKKWIYSAVGHVEKTA